MRDLTSGLTRFTLWNTARIVLVCGYWWIALNMFRYSAIRLAEISSRASTTVVTVSVPGDSQDSNPRTVAANPLYRQ